METPEVKAAAREVGDSETVEWLARTGYAASALIHLLLAFLALQVAWHGSGRKADQSGALALLAQNPLGTLLLWVLVVGFLGLAVWQVTEAIAGHGETGDRVKAGAKAILYAVLSWSAFGFARGSGSSSTQQTRDFTASLMGAPGGRLLVGAVGLGVIAVGGYHVYKGWAARFLGDLVGHPGAFAERMGRIGYIAKGIALIVVGGLFVAAAIHHRSKEATGLDGAMRTLREQPFGQILLTVVALGLGAFGIYTMARAKYARV
ncbi:MAG: DUF1206 domain-containing protein [Tetrasphaera sp.]|jgi:hypothetical protein|nr:DUF1206 domain-containing protein [Tetrasphaera sp.]